MSGTKNTHGQVVDYMLLAGKKNKGSNNKVHGS